MITKYSGVSHNQAHFCAFTSSISGDSERYHEKFCDEV